ncbi:MAG: CRISPR-associated protein Cas4 [Planctomycetes bacterium]|nr:CRISPR-associated protein Cas4 [Planctomycetota bacterium]
MFSEDDLLPISALQHYVFCPRQCGLIHLEQVWSENLFTAEGRRLHEKVHDSGDESRPGVRTVRGLRLRSLRLGLVGQADVVEFQQSEVGVELPGADGLWRPFPVEYKRGKPKRNKSDEIQLCAQAMCLEEMLDFPIECGAFFYGRPRRRTQVDFTAELRQRTEQAIQDLHDLIDSARTPTARYGKKCDSCSLYQHCLPKATGVRKNLDAYMQKAFELPQGDPDA